MWKPISDKGLAEANPTTLSTFKGFHHRGISQLAFSTKGDKLASVGMDDASEAADSAAQQVLNDEDLLFVIASFAGGGEGGGSERQRLIARAAAARSLLACSAGFRLAVLRADHPVWQHFVAADVWPHRLFVECGAVATVRA